ncbi:hypothetical protein KRX51_06300 [Corynebacterium sp. TAE3-ERU12]|uniref:hypothetical protein n=1 Tax=Corynebacterium sp. TAE3-ERU12 TaxID=2849491 RepID=UPI001C48DBBE|nr:hypothetical protein [Corynebacterium sp. TAE3-ERU12]MBV7295530.1 hypothetical protein [Corynebacterium sp. TAE3-ERU12]
MATPSPVDIAGTTDIDTLRSNYDEIVAELAADSETTPARGAEILERAHQLLQDTLGGQGEQRG